MTSLLAWPYRVLVWASPAVSLARFKWTIFLLTFITYAAFHASRKPITVVKNVLNQDCDGKEPPPGVNATVDPHWCDWAPFGMCIVSDVDSRALLLVHWLIAAG